jgi:hypothetical protein
MGHFLFDLDNGLGAISRENRDLCLADDALKKMNFGEALAKKEARPKGPGTRLLVAAQYSQELPGNNGLFRVWLADFGPKQP